MTRENASISAPGLILKMPFTVTSANTDMYGRLRLSALINMLIQSSIRSADELGFGFSELESQDLFWVLSRFSVEIDRPLFWKQGGSVETWPKDIDRLLYIRDFIVSDEMGNRLARATSGWLTVDMKAKRSRLMEPDIPASFTRLKEHHALTARPEKLGPVTGEAVSEIGVSYFDLDINRHVTTTRYFDWMMDSFPPEFHEKMYPKAVSANFIKEIRPGEKIRLIRSSDGIHGYHFEGHNLSRDITAFRGKIVFGE